MRLTFPAVAVALLATSPAHAVVAVNRHAVPSDTQTKCYPADTLFNVLLREERMLPAWEGMMGDKAGLVVLENKEKWVVVVLRETDAGDVIACPVQTGTHGHVQGESI